MAKKKKKKFKTPEKTQAQIEWDQTIDEMGEALDSGSYIMAVWSLNGTQVKLYRKSKDFPVDLFPRVLDTLEENLNAEKTEIESRDAPTTIPTGQKV